MKRALLVLIAWTAVGEVLGEDDEVTIEGAWADVAEPRKPCLVVANMTVWTLQEDGLWMPAHASSSVSSSASFSLLTQATNRWCDLSIEPSPYQRERMIASGEVPPRETCILRERERLNDYKDQVVSYRELVRCKMPDLSKGLRMKSYWGFWKLLLKTDRRHCELRPADGDESSFYLKLRNDGVIIGYNSNAKSSAYRTTPYEIDRVLAVDGGLRFDYREEYRGYEDPLNCLYRALWLDGEDRLHVFGSDDHQIFGRTNESFVDPIDVRTKMKKSKAYDGVWGVSREFNIMILGFDKGGTGVMSLFMGVIPFKWKCGWFSDEIVCTPDPEVALVYGCRWKSFVCRYSVLKDQMIVELPPNEDEGEDDPTFKELDFRTSVQNVVEVHKRLKEVKTTQEWKWELESARRKKAKRETPEAIAARKKYADEKRATRKAWEAERLKECEAEQRRREERRKKR